MRVEEHPLLRVSSFTSVFSEPLSGFESPEWLRALLKPDAVTPFAPDESVRTDVRDMLRLTGYKPTGRGKPASEYLVRAAGDGSLGTINAAVDACNAVSLHSGFPISVVDVERTRPPLRVGVAQPGERYVFNRAGHEIDLAGLLCLFDEEGPCANAIKDAQRTKTDENTTRTLSILWGCKGHEDRLAAATAWYRELLQRAGAVTADGGQDGT